MMKYIYFPQIQIVPEWYRCYYDYEQIDQIITKMKTISLTRKHLNLTLKHISQSIRQKNEQKLVVKRQQLLKQKIRLKQVRQKCNLLFKKYHENQLKKLFSFIELKMLILKNKVNKVYLYSSVIDPNDNQLMSLIENTYIEVYYLYRMITCNKRQQLRITKEYQMSQNNKISQSKNRVKTQQHNRNKNMAYQLIKTIIRVNQFKGQNQEQYKSQNQIQKKHKQIDHYSENKLNKQDYPHQSEPQSRYDSLFQNKNQSQFENQNQYQYYSQYEYQNQNQYEDQLNLTGNKILICQNIVQQKQHSQINQSQKKTNQQKLNHTKQLLKNKVLIRLQKLYRLKKKSASHSQTMDQLISHGDRRTHNKQKRQYFVLGILMGLCFVAFAVVIFIKQFYNITLQENLTYQSDFPIWRGVSYFVAFQWILGFCFMFLEHMHINYKLFLNIKGKCMPKSMKFLVDAAIMTLMYLLLIGLYFLEGSPIINTGFRYYGHTMWLILIVYLLVPLPFTYYQGKLYFYKLVLNTIFAPFAFIKPDSQTIWFSQHMVSFSQPCADFFYSVCKFNDLSAKCDTTNATLIIFIVFFTYRIIINTKTIAQKGWLLTLPYYGIIRSFGGLITAIASYTYRKYLTNQLFALYMVSAIFSTLCAVYADIRGDWNLLQSDGFLRKNRFFNKKYMYYASMILDLLLRCNWTLNLSPQIVANIGLIPFYGVMMVAYIQLIRRGLWNVFFLQKFHLQNSESLAAIVDDSELQSIVNKKYQNEIQRRQMKQGFKKNNGQNIYSNQQQIQKQVKIKLEEVGLMLQQREKIKNQWRCFQQKQGLWVKYLNKLLTKNIKQIEFIKQNKNS